MAFRESPRFPDNIALDAVGGPSWLTEVVEVESGFEQRNIVWSSARQRYTVALTAMDNTARDDLIAFLRSVAVGRAHGFRFKDHNDYSATHADYGAGLGVFEALGNSQFQMWKRYTAGSYYADREITKPVTGTLEVKVGAVLKTETTHYTVNYATGIVTMLGSPTDSPTSWAGQFDVPVRLNTDYAGLRAMIKGLTDWGSIELIEVRV